MLDSLLSDTSLEEPACTEELVEHLERCGRFKLYREVEGVALVNMPGKTPGAGLRVDVVIVPREAAIAGGWRLGPIGIECKGAGKKLGPVAAQAFDYRLALFEIAPSTWIKPAWIFIFPFQTPKGDVDSLMAANGVGVAHWMPGLDRRLRLRIGGYRVATIGGAPAAGRADIEVNDQPMPGRKTGSR